VMPVLRDGTANIPAGGKYSDDSQRYIQEVTMEIYDGRTPKKGRQGNLGIV
jgi:hypothetical protein